MYKMGYFRFKQCIYCKKFININNTDINKHLNECLQIYIQKINKTYLIQEIKSKSILIQFKFFFDID